MVGAIRTFQSQGTEAIVRPLSVARCDLDKAFLFQNMPFLLRAGSFLKLVDPSCSRIFGHNFFKGPFPFGHECVGEILSIGENVKNFKKGDLVVVPFQISCGVCSNCAHDLTAFCENTPPLSLYGFGQHLQFGGAVADFLKIPFADGSLYKLPGDMDYKHLPSLADNVTDAYSRVAPLLKNKADTRILILSGKATSVGLYAVLIAKHLGCPYVTYLDRETSNLQVARNAGADEQLSSFSQVSGKYDLIVDCCAGEKALAQACRFLHPKGTIASTGIYFKKTVLPLVELYSKNGTFITGLTQSKPEGEACLELVKQGLNLGIITSTIASWEEADQAFLEKGNKVIVYRERIT